MLRGAKEALMFARAFATANNPSVTPGKPPRKAAARTGVSRKAVKKSK